MLYTGGTTGFPKGVLWRHEDVWRTLGGGIDFTTGERLADEWEQSSAARPGRPGWSGSPPRRSFTAAPSGARCGPLLR